MTEYHHFNRWWSHICYISHFWKGIYSPQNIIEGHIWDTSSGRRHPEQTPEPPLCPLVNRSPHGLTVGTLFQVTGDPGLDHQWPERAPKKKTRAFREGDSKLLRSVKKTKQLKVKFIDNNEVHGTKLENKIQQYEMCVQGWKRTDRWKSGQSQLSELVLQQVQFKNKISILSCPQPNRPPTLASPTGTSLSHLSCLIFQSWISLLHHCLQPHQEMLSPPLPLPSVCL